MRRITKEQERLFMSFRNNGESQIISAAKAGISLRSAKRIEADNEKVESKKLSNPRDPFGDVWAKHVVPLLEKDPGLQAKILLEDLQEHYPGKYPDNCLRTLQRRVSHWKAIHGPEKERMFRQENPPGWQSISDFTKCDDLGVTINGEPFCHLLYHFRLPYSGWEDGCLIHGGESFVALSKGLQQALQKLGGCTETHRTDSLSAAYKNYFPQAKEDFTEAYKKLCANYGIKATRNNKGVSHENGCIEVSHRHSKERILQRLKIRGSSDFSSVEEYENFIRTEIFEKPNSKRCQKRISEERALLRPLPKHKCRDYEVESVFVPTTGIISVRQVHYSINSKVIGKTLTVYLYDDHLECFLGADHIASKKRLRWKGGTPRIASIDYRDVIPELVRKPQAFRHYVYREHLFPTEIFKKTWNILDSRLDERTACKEYVKILKLAADSDEQEISKKLERLLIDNQLPTATAVESKTRSLVKAIPHVYVDPPDLEQYEKLLHI